MSCARVIRIVEAVVLVGLAVTMAVLMVANNATLPDEFKNIASRWAALIGLGIGAIMAAGHAYLDSADRDYYSGWTWARWFFVVSALSIANVLPLSTSPMTYIVIFAIGSASMYREYAQSVHEANNERRFLTKDNFKKYQEIDDAGIFTTFAKGEELGLLSSVEQSTDVHPGADPHITSFLHATAAYAWALVLAFLFMQVHGKSAMQSPAIFLYIFYGIYLAFHFAGPLVFTVFYPAINWRSNTRVAVYSAALVLLGTSTMLNVGVFANLHPTLYA